MAISGTVDMDKHRFADLVACSPCIIPLFFSCLAFLSARRRGALMCGIDIMIGREGWYLYATASEE